jgi:hypothetical protein
VAVVDSGPLAAAAKGLTRALARATLVGGSSLVMGEKEEGVWGGVSLQWAREGGVVIE